ncbi:aminopeptidase [bacterium (candidate division B38) B3_B38]|nr:MAG: aminopeptidase [bacterium (candidate division B38) B3_B38]
MEGKNSGEKKPRAREVGLVVGMLPTGKWNAITDVEGVKVGHVTLIEGENIRTGVTAILPHSGNLFLEKVPAAIYVGNGFGKLAGSTQVEELGNIETPILLTNTLNVPLVADGLIEYMLSLPGNEQVRSINPVVGETNDSWLNDIRGRHINKQHVRQAIEKAASGAVEEGSVGAGTGTICFGFKGGIGTSSRVLPPSQGGYTVGVLVQSNYGGILTINGAPVGRELRGYTGRGKELQEGSCMIVVATDAPLMHRNLKRLAKRAMLGLSRTGSYSSSGSGDYVIAFSAAKELRISAQAGEKVSPEELTNRMVSPLFMAVVEATEEAVYNSLFKATTMTGRDGYRAEAIPVEKVVELCRKYGVLNWDKTLPPQP